MPEEVARSRKRKLPKVISAAEASALLAAADDGTFEGARDVALLTLLYRAGLRVGEVVRLTPRDVESDGVVKVYDGKGGDGTTYFSPTQVGPALERWLRLRAAVAGNPDSPLFLKRDGSPLSVRYVQRLVRRLKERVGIYGHCTPHTFRHTMATELLEEGFNLSEVQSVLRHASLSTTEVYLHVRDEQLRRKIATRTGDDRVGGGDL